MPLSSQGSSAGSPTFPSAPDHAVTFGNPTAKARFNHSAVLRTPAARNDEIRLD